MAALTVDEVAVPLRSFDLDLTLEVASTVALVGPSGAGKSTLLRAVAGLVRPARGRIAVGDEVWFDASARISLPPDRRSVGLVFQDYALFPHLTVRQNIEFARRRAADEYLERFHLRGLEQARPPELSGGERQRVALARALARDPRVLLLDEPISALDAHTKAAVRAEMSELLSGLEIPTLLVTHDFDDAAALAGSVSVIVDGRVRQTGSPAELVANPADAFVAAFTGANLLHGRAASGSGGSARVLLEDGTTLVTADEAHGDVALAVYPWDITISLTAPDDSALNVVSGPVRSVAELGNRARVAVGSVTAEITVESLARLGIVQGLLVYASFKATGTRVVAVGPAAAGSGPTAG